MANELWTAAERENSKLRAETYGAFYQQEITKAARTVAALIEALEKAASALTTISNLHGNRLALKASDDARALLDSLKR